MADLCHQVSDADIFFLSHPFACFVDQMNEQEGAAAWEMELSYGSMKCIISNSSCAQFSKDKYEFYSNGWRILRLFVCRVVLRLCVKHIFMCSRIA